MAAYHNSFSGPFIFDDGESIKDNPNIRRLWPIWQAMWSPPNRTVSGRPVVSLSLAVNYQLSRLNVWSYHAFNLGVHILATMTLFGLVRRTLRTPRLRERFERAAYWLAMCCALVWLVHPLQTESVTYIIQRAESLMGLFYLLTLYCAARGLNGRSRQPGWWLTGAVLACAVGMGCKEVMATAPVMALLYDRVFVGRSLREIFRRRWAFYAGLAGTWLVLAALLATNPRGASAGFNTGRITSFEYACTQCEVILHYLRMSFWPKPLVLDYLWPIARNFSDVAWHAVGLACLLIATVTALRYRPALGFAAAWVFIILGPTSSIVPIFDVAFEHRMYLPLAGMICGVVCLCYLGAKALSDATSSSPRLLAALGAACCLAVTGVFTGLTIRRNHDYRSALAIWNDTILKRPGNVRAYNNRAVSLELLGRFDMAIGDYSTAIELSPTYSVSYHGRGVSHSKKGMHQRAIADFAKAIELDPDYVKAYNNRGIAYTSLGCYKEALADFRTAIELDPLYSRAYNNRAIAHTRMLNYDLAIADCSKAIDLDPHYDKAYNNRGVAYGGKGMQDEALRDFTKAIELNREYATAYSARGLAYAQKGQYHRAVADFDAALRLNPNDHAARHDRNKALGILRRQGGDKKP